MRGNSEIDVSIYEQCACEKKRADFIGMKKAGNILKENFPSEISTSYLSL